MARSIIWRSLCFSFILVLLVNGSAYAEQLIVNGVTGNTSRNGNNDNAYTSTASTYYYLYVNERVWGSTPNPLKDEKILYRSWSTTSGTASICQGCYNGYESTGHQYIQYPGMGGSWFYTSGSGSNSSWCWWSGGSGC